MRSPTSARRGILARAGGALLGVIVASALVVGMQLPLLRGRSRTYVELTQLIRASTPAQLAWPSVGSAALDIPALGVALAHDNRVAPIASLTKMMTAYVSLQHLPLTLGALGPCHVVTASDVSVYDEMVAIDESSVPVTLGEQLCESQLLNGLLVHSAGNYAVMLANMVAGTTSQFVTMMNQEAKDLGLSDTRYADVTGYSSQSVSTALNQARLAVVLMRSALIRSIVIQSSVTLPVAGSVASYTPFVGVDNVIGVKSGRTSLAGGCDVLAMTFKDGSRTRVLYAVVLGQRGGNLLGPAGTSALALARSALAAQRVIVVKKNEPLGTISWGAARVGFALARQRDVTWWTLTPRPTISVHVRSFTSAIRRGQVVGYLEIRSSRSFRFTLRALGSLSPPTLIERLR